MHYLELTNHLVKTPIASRDNNRQTETSNVKLDRQRDEIVHSCEYKDYSVASIFYHRSIIINNIKMGGHGGLNILP